MKNLALTLTLALLLAACGIKGDLTRPSDINQEKEKEQPRGLF